MRRKRRADRYWESRDLGGLALCIEQEDEAETRDAIRKVRAVHFGNESGTAGEPH